VLGFIDHKCHGYAELDTLIFEYPDNPVAQDSRMTDHQRMMDFREAFRGTEYHTTIYNLYRELKGASFDTLVTAFRQRISFDEDTAMQSAKRKAHHTTAALTTPSSENPQDAVMVRLINRIMSMPSDRVPAKLFRMLRERDPELLLEWLDIRQKDRAAHPTNGGDAPRPSPVYLTPTAIPQQYDMQV